MTDLLALAERVEQEEPSRELADEVLRATTDWKAVTTWEGKRWANPDGHYTGIVRPNPLTSLDAAIAPVADDTDGWLVINHAVKKCWNDHGPSGRKEYLPRYITAAGLRALEGDGG